jgi:hypothetical protein
MRDTSRHVAGDGSIDDEYTWDRPVTTYLSTLEYMRLLLLKARLSTTRDLEHPGPADAGC